MKVICIDASIDANEWPYDVFKLIEGEVYTVIDELMGVGKNGLRVLCYSLLEGDDQLYLKSKFIPLSNIDETELIKERLEKIILILNICF